MLTLNERHGRLGPTGLIGIGATGLGTAAAAVLSWFFIGWGSLLIAGTMLVSIELWRQGLSPKRAVVATGAGLAVGGISWGVLRIVEAGSADQHGDYVLANAAGLTIGSGILATRTQSSSTIPATSHATARSWLPPRRRLIRLHRRIR